MPRIIVYPVTILILLSLALNAWFFGRSNQLEISIGGCENNLVRSLGLIEKVQEQNRELLTMAQRREAQLSSCADVCGPVQEVTEDQAKP